MQYQYFLLVAPDITSAAYWKEYFSGLSACVWPDAPTHYVTPKFTYSEAFWEFVCYRAAQKFSQLVRGLNTPSTFTPHVNIKRNCFVADSKISRLALHINLERIECGNICAVYPVHVVEIYSLAISTRGQEQTTEHWIFIRWKEFWM